MSSERETDRLEIIELTQTLSQERRKRDVEKQLIDELKQQVLFNVISVVEFQRIVGPNTHHLCINDVY